MAELANSKKILESRLAEYTAKITEILTVAVICVSLVRTERGPLLELVSTWTVHNLLEIVFGTEAGHCIPRGCGALITSSYGTGSAVSKICLQLAL